MEQRVHKGFEAWLRVNMEELRLHHNLLLASGHNKDSSVDMQQKLSICRESVKELDIDKWADSQSCRRVTDRGPLDLIS